MGKIVVFDFDGTIVSKDTLLEFIKYTQGKFAFCVIFLLFSPLLMLMKLHLYSNEKVKQKLWSFIYQGVSLSDFQQMCESFAKANKHLIYCKAQNRIEEHITAGDKVLIITANIENIVSLFAHSLGVYDVIGTQIEVKDDKLTGLLATPNCYGREKVRRLREKYPNRNDYELIVYGDSRGDFELMNYADKRYYKFFTE